MNELMPGINDGGILTSFGEPATDGSVSIQEAPWQSKFGYLNSLLGIGEDMRPLDGKEYTNQEIIGGMEAIK